MRVELPLALELVRQVAAEHLKDDRDKRAASWASPGASLRASWRLKAREMQASTTPGSGRSSPGSLCRARAPSLHLREGAAGRYCQGSLWLFELGDAILLALEKLGTLRSSRCLYYGVCAISHELLSLNRNTGIERLAFLKWLEAELNEVVVDTIELRAVGSHVRAGADRRPAQIGQACGRSLPLIMDIGYKHTCSRPRWQRVDQSTDSRVMPRDGHAARRSTVRSAQ